MGFAPGDTLWESFHHQRFPELFFSFLKKASISSSQDDDDYALKFVLYRDKAGDDLNWNLSQAKLS